MARRKIRQPQSAHARGRTCFSFTLSSLNCFILFLSFEVWVKIQFFHSVLLVLFHLISVLLEQLAKHPILILSLARTISSYLCLARDISKSCSYFIYSVMYDFLKRTTPDKPASESKQAHAERTEGDRSQQTHEQKRASTAWLPSFLNFLWNH